MFDRILVPLDGSDEAARALPVAAEMARHFGSTLVLLEVVPTGQEWHLHTGEHDLPPGKQSSDAEERAATAAWRHLERIGASLNPLPVVSDVRVGRPALTITECAVDQHCDLICLSAHGMGRRSLKRTADPKFQGHPVLWMLGAISDRVAHTSPVPVLIVRPDQAALTGA